MRTTLEIDDAVLAAAKEIAQTENKTAGAELATFDKPLARAFPNYCVLVSGGKP